ncbi:MAG: HAD-IB family phosphatase [Anaerolineales bacterium]
MTLFSPLTPKVTTDWASFDLIFFDCDSTLCTIEGIDELARWAGQTAQVAALTDQAMNGDMPLEAVYSRRLELLNPTREQLQRLSQLYQQSVIPDARAVIAALHRLGRAVFIVSGGLAAGVREFGLWLGLPEDRICAVEVEYDQLSGRWWEPWKNPAGNNHDERYLTHDGGPLTLGQGKAEVIGRLRREHRGRALLIGDGISDLAAAGAVDVFAGFGGVVSRERVREQAAVFIHCAELAPVLPLALARAEVPLDLRSLYTRGVELIREGQVSFCKPAQRQGLLQKVGHG